MASFQLAFLLTLLLIFLGSWSLILLRCRKSGQKLPPGPLRLPIIGHLHLFGRLPHHTLHHLAQKHGPIMSLRLGLKPTIVISSPQAAELFLKTHDKNFASRANTRATEVLYYGSKGLIFSEYGPYWQSMRKVCTMELMSAAKVEGFKEMRREEVGRLVGRLKEARGPVVDVSDEVEQMVEEMSCRMVFGRCSDESFDLKGALRNAAAMLSAPNLADYLPFLAPLDIQGFARRLRATSKRLDKVLETIIDEHEENSTKTQSQQKSLINILLSLKNNTANSPDDLPYVIERENIKAIVFDMMMASVETSSSSIEWAMSELLRSPVVMQKLREELNNVVGEDKLVEEVDLAKLKYLDFVIKETLRLHPILIPRVSIEDITIDGYFIRKNSHILVNTRTLGRDTKVWGDNADEFIPERFIGSDIDVKGQHFQLIPFGSGRRVCPGMNLGLTNIRLSLAQLVHCFNWELPKGTSPNDLDMSEKVGLAVVRAKHLLAAPAYRLRV